jgi:DNA-binding transcriptional LysR family regulator
LIDLHVLEAFDALLWLRTAEEVERRYGTTQATISRYRKRCLALFELALERRQGEWELIGDSSILLRERQVHQLARWRGYRPLRLEATYWSAPLLSTPALAGWVLGVSNIVGVRRTFQLVEERVVDALITGLPDLPTQRHPDLIAIPIIRMPVFYVAAPEHPLFSRAQLSV